MLNPVVATVRLTGGDAAQGGTKDRFLTARARVSVRIERPGVSEAASLPFLEFPSYLQMKKCQNRLHTFGST